MDAIPDPQPDPQDDQPAADLERVNDILAVWAARSAAESDALIDRFEAMGYEEAGPAHARTVGFAQNKALFVHIIDILRRHVVFNADRLKTL